MRCRMELFFENRHKPVTFFFVWPEDSGQPPSPSEVEELATVNGGVTTETGGKVSWDPENVEFAGVYAVPFEPPAGLPRASEEPKRIPPEPAMRRNG